MRIDTGDRALDEIPDKGVLTAVMIRAQGQHVRLVFRTAHLFRPAVMCVETAVPGQQSRAVMRVEGAPGARLVDTDRDHPPSIAVRIRPRTSADSVSTCRAGSTFLRFGILDLSSF